jgi:hypothetical protein
MARDSNGSYTATTGQPVVGGTTISSTTFNSLVSDISTELTDSLSRSGKGGMLVPFKNNDGTVAAPGMTFINETGSGIYRAGSNDVRMSIAGVDLVKWLSGIVEHVSGVLRSGVANGASAIGFKLNTAATYSTSGAKLLSVQNNGTEKFSVDKAGILSVADSTGGSSNAATVSAPSLAASYGLTLPAALPASTLPLVVSSAGVMSASTIATAQIADASVTRAKMASVGQQISSSSGSFTTTSASYVDVTNLTVSITTTGRAVVLELVPDGSGSTSRISVTRAATTTTGLFIAILRGATKIYETDPSLTGASATLGLILPPSIVKMVDPVAAGTYTYKVQALALNGPSDTVGFTNCKLVAYEL